MARPINFANVNITLRQFNEIASGKYNAGEVKLSSDHSLAKINHHVHFIDSNNTRLSHAEVLAIKSAFVKALSTSGVAGVDLDKIRQELGLAANGPTDLKLQQRSIRPLSRQQIRNILDRNAAAINNTLGAGTIRTYGETHAGYSATERNRIKDNRLFVNMRTAENRPLEVSKDVARIQSIIAGDVDFHSVEERRKMAEAILQQKNAILQRSNGRPSNEPNASFMFSVGQNGLSVEFKLGMSEAEYVNRLDDLLLRLDGMHVPTNDVLSARREFRSLGTLTARSAWLDALGTTPADNLKIRTAIVSLLQDRGFGDYQTLSLANRLTDQDARMFLANLISLPQNLRGQALLGHPGIAPLAQRAGDGANVPEAERTFVPPLSPEKFNDFVYSTTQKFTSDDIPHRFRTVIDESVAAMRQRFGADVFPAKPSPMSLTSSWGEVLGKNAAGAPAATPERVRERLAPEIATTAASNFARLYVKEMLTAAGGKPSVALEISNALLRRHEGLLDTLAAAKNPQEAKEILDAKRDELSSMIRVHQECAKAKASIEAKCREIFARTLGVPLAMLAPGEPNTLRVADKAVALAQEIVDGKNPAKTDEEIAAAFTKIAEDHVNKLAEGLAKINSLNLPDGAKDKLSAQLMRTYNPAKVDFDAIVAKAKLVNLKALGNVLASKGPKDVAYASMNALLDLMRELTKQIFSEKGVAEIGASEFAVTRNMLLAAAGADAPGFEQKLQEFLARPDVNADYRKADHESPAACLLHIKPIFIPDDDEPAVAPLRERTADKELLARFAPDGAATQQAVALGYAKCELAMLEKTAALYQKATGCSLDDAVAAALDHNSPARRLVSYGGRFTESSANFKAGLKLLEDFKPWFSSVCAAADALRVDSVNQPPPPGASSTIVNISRDYISNKCAYAYEKFLFEEIAINKDIPLNPAQPEGAFGMDSNPAMRFVGRGYTKSATNTLAQIPPERRHLLYKILDALSPLSETRDEKDILAKSLTSVNCEIISRVMRHYDEFEALDESGRLTRENLLPKLFPGVQNIATLTNKKIGDADSDRLYYEIVPQQFNGDYSCLAPIGTLMSDCGLTLDEAVAAYKAGQKPPLAPFISAANGGINELDGTAKGGRKTMFGDLLRPENPQRNKKDILAPENNVFKVVFPDGTTMKALEGAEGDPQVKATNNAIADKIADFCGGVHPKQLNSVYFALSQAALSNVNKGFVADGIYSTEHMPVTYTFSRNADTGAVTIRYSEPEGFPIKFHWETTIQLDGSSTSTTMVREN